MPYQIVVRRLTHVRLVSHRHSILVFDGVAMAVRLKHRRYLILLLMQEI